ncbi:MAG: hypothetical protein JWQ34_2043 [Mucilaginibacter sp.]|uniref:DUF4251 domain-containing protein n=1 Tax=Mucilaginibacter sp. TaxID=1882438 RepID=UPI0026170089|nr:DUF4251 domain-containing protein [Mucilaginibacter sp.]MDB5003818.1 hypothetical protein [Mucilaginibacter sp.]
MKNLRGFLLLLIMVSAFATTVNAQKKDKKMTRDSIQAAAVERLLISKKFIFTAEYASPAQGGGILLNSYYYLEITPDVVSSVLPYYGTTYSGGGTSESSIKLSTKNFDYSGVKTAAGHWYVSIKPKDSTTEQELVLDVKNDGTASLVVLSKGRGRMSYTGIIEAKEESK